MDRLTIGAFARASRLSAKALRRYDELGLLPPASVDAYTGYRYYDATQLERARLVAWLRRIGMPLVTVQEVCDLYESDPAEAARSIRAYWAQVETETSARRDLAVFLADRLSRPSRPARPPGKDTRTMTDLLTPLTIRYAARTDLGLVRESNQDAAYATARILAVADGFGSEGAPASAAAIAALKALDSSVRDGSLRDGSLRDCAVPGGSAAGGPTSGRGSSAGSSGDWDASPAPDTPASPSWPASPSPVGRRIGDLLNALEDAVHRAHAAVSGFAGSGTTLTAMVWTGSQLALAHIGDTRVQLLRNGDLLRMTHDHTVTQSMIDAGTLTEEEAASHPQRTILLRALGGGEGPPHPELRLCEAQAGDRYLLSSDGLFRAVADDEIRRALEAATDPDEAVDELIALAHRAGGPDNIACVVADVVPED
ncbi:MerR family transcriptional regulator [Streptomyces sp. NPDC020965]|uniref:MerR family transcriptional regulator n=1 Tax=Streptomyces sp. NPDC020965 TaxID=3365105 RepID=UPI003796DDC1